MKKILVTGGAGYIGSFMVRELASVGFEPIVLDNLSSGHLECVKDFRLEQIDLVSQTDKLDGLLSTESFGGVIHMASFIQMGESFVNPAAYYENNVVGFINLVNAMVKYKMPYLILSSSAGVYGDPENVPIQEDDVKNPLNPYGETKYIMERILEDYDEAYGIKFVSLRYFNAAGASMDGAIGEDHPNESHLIPNLIKKGLKGEKIEIFGDDYDTLDGTNVRDYIHVLDIASSHVMALKALMSGVDSNFYNIGVGRGYSNNELIKEVEKVIDKKLNVEYKTRRPGDAASVYASTEKIQKELGWKPKYTIHDIIKSAYLWHRKRPKGYLTP